jgi:hypothetical protein
MFTLLVAAIAAGLLLSLRRPRNPILRGVLVVVLLVAIAYMIMIPLGFD